MLVPVMVLLSAWTAPAWPGSLDGVRPLLLRCFRTGHASSCETALTLIEALQRRAAARERYPCQTLLLGLQAEVVMVQWSEGRGEKSRNTMQASELLCAGL